jgi:hypothetical protein
MAALIDAANHRRRPWQRTSKSPVRLIKQDHPSASATSIPTPTWNPLCGSCTALFSAKKEQAKTVLHQQWSDLEKSAEKHCYICTRLRSHLERSHADEQIREDFNHWKSDFMPLSCEIDHFYSGFADLKFSAGKETSHRSNPRFPNLIAIVDSGK